MKIAIVTETCPPEVYGVALTVHRWGGLPVSAGRAIRPASYPSSP